MPEVTHVFCFGKNEGLDKPDTLCFQMHTDSATHASATSPAEVLENLENRVFYHGTSKRAARRILRDGLRDYSWTEDSPQFKYKAEQGLVRWMHGGSYGRGTYISCNWRAALCFGPVLFRLELQPATRIVHLDVPPDPKVMDSLQREFGKQIITASPWKVMPRNKRLTLNEAIQLARYHCAKSETSNWWRSGKPNPHEKLMLDLRNILVRYGIHGWGEVSDIGGIVIFATDRLKVAEVVLSLPTEALYLEARDPTRSFRRFDTLASLAAATRAARNRGAANTLAWVEAANTAIQGTMKHL